MDIYKQNYRRLIKILGPPDKLPEYLKLKSGGFMDLNLDVLGADGESITIALSHYFVQNGDMIPDPDMEIRIYPEMRMAEALTYQDSFGYREVYPEPGRVDPAAKQDLNTFLGYWMGNLLKQGFRAD